MTILLQAGLDYQLFTVATLNTYAVFPRCFLRSIYHTLISIYCTWWICSVVVLRKQTHIIYALCVEHTVQGFRNHSN